MPNPGWEEPAAPQADGRLVEFIERRRQEQSVERRQRIQLGVIAGLVAIVLALAVSNVVLLNRLL
ncbi:MAG TPA: hypothetical protein VFL90_10005, partial [Methylomirabilota bacterium]|nr:hypothetical protein [Methylomirabilota bacterium]